MNSPTNQSDQALMREVIQRVAVGPDRGRDIPLEEAEQVTQAMLEGKIDDVQAAVFLIALRMKRESLDESRGIFKALQASVETVECDLAELVCLADPFDGYVRHTPMSPFLPAVLAACGLPALMHGVQSVGPKHGVTACKVYELAGMNAFQSTHSASESLKEVGWGYIDQSQYAPELNAFSGLRDRIVKRTILTTLERLLMPIRASGKTHLVLGYVHKAYPQIYGAIAKLAGYDSALLVKGLEGGLTPALNKPLRRYVFDQECLQFIDFADASKIDSIKEVIETELFVDSTKAGELNDQNSSQNPVEHCLDTGLTALSGKDGVAKESLSLAAAQILLVRQELLNFATAVDLVNEVIDSGKALSYFNNALSSSI